MYGSNSVMMRMIAIRIRRKTFSSYSHTHARLEERRIIKYWSARSFSTEFGTDEDKYLELKQLKDIKSEEFYDFQASKRRYFYYIDLQGRLFLEDTRPKNIATSLKSTKFLRFFFSQIRPNTLVNNPDDEEEFLEYPYRSPCGKEMNFIKCADLPFVFDSLHYPTEEEEKRTKKNCYLSFGGGEMKMIFDPQSLKISITTGRLYHQVETKHFHGLGLIRSQLAVELSKYMVFYDSGNTEFIWQSMKYPIEIIDCLVN